MPSLPSELDRLWDTLSDDADRAQGFIASVPPAVTVYGGARWPESSPFYRLAEELGRRLAERGILPRTGGGPSIMEAVLKGFIDERSRAMDDLPWGVANVLRFRDSGSEARTQAVRVQLPFESDINPFVEMYQITEKFPFRKLALIENARGHVCFPGGLGSLDELCEVLALSELGRMKAPVAVFPGTFYASLLDTLERVTSEQRHLIDRSAWQQIKRTDNMDELLDHLDTWSRSDALGPTADERLQDIDREMEQGVEALRPLAAAVTFAGAARLSPDDPVCDKARELARILASRGCALRVGNLGPTADAVCAGNAQGGATGHVQAVLLDARGGGVGAGPRAESDDRVPPGVTVCQRPHNYVVYREMLGSKSSATVCLPADLQTLDFFFSTLCGVQCGKRERTPIILLGKDYWQPIIDSARATMLDVPIPTLSAGDLSLFCVTDDPEEAARVIASG